MKDSSYRFAWIAHKFVSSKSPTRYASAASCNARTAWLWNRRSVCMCIYRNTKTKVQLRHNVFQNKNIKSTTVYSLTQSRGRNAHATTQHKTTTAFRTYLEILSNLTNKSLEWKFPDEKLSWFLILTDLTKRNGSWPVAMRFLHSAGGWSALTCRLDTYHGIA